MSCFAANKTRNEIIQKISKELIILMDEMYNIDSVFFFKGLPIPFNAK